MCIKMCSVDSCYHEIKECNTPLNLVGAVCRKCNEKPAKVVLQQKFPYCRECFLLYFRHKYSAGLGKAKLLKNGDKVLVAFSGSLYSVCILHLIFCSLIEDRKKKTRFEVEVIFIDERLNITNEERYELFKIVDSLLASYDYKVHFTTLFTNGGEFLVNRSDIDRLSSDDSGDHLISNIKSITSQQDLLLQLRKNLLFEAARKLNCNKIFTAETSDHIAANIISNLALGRGKQLSSDTGMTEIRNGITLVRPLRDCSKKEVAFYNIFNSLSLSLNSSLEKNKFSSIQKLSDTFITELQQTYPSTVSTVVSTGNKVSPHEKKSNSCFICQGELDTDACELSALEALKISNLVSVAGKVEQNFLPTNSRSELEFGSESIDCISPKDRLILNKLCYACRKIYEESNLQESLLEGKLQRYYKEQITKAMHSEIKNFLL